MRGVIRESDARRIPSSVMQGSVVRGFTDGGTVVFEGRLSAPPAIRGGLASFAAQGEAVRAAKRTGRLLYQTRDYSIWTDIKGNPYNSVGQGSEKFQVAVNAGHLYYRIEEGATVNTGDIAGLTMWAPGTPGGITRVAFSKTAVGFGSDWRFRISEHTGPLVAVLNNTDYVMTTGTVDHATAFVKPDAIAIHALWTGANGAGPTVFEHSLITNLRVNGITSGDTFTGSQVVTDVGGRLGYDTTNVRATGLNVLPLDWTSGSWADLLSYIATLEERYWRVLEGGRLEYDAWGTKEWTVYQADGATVDLTPLELYNQVTVKYVDVGGGPREVTVTADPDPLAATGIVNVWEESLADVQPDSTLATAVANNLLPRVSGLREQGRIDVVKAYDSTGREAAREIRAGDTVRVADRDMNTATLHRIFETDQNDNHVSLGIESGVSIAAMLARAGLVGARAPSTAQLPELPPPRPLEAATAEAEPTRVFADRSLREAQRHGPGRFTPSEIQHEHFHGPGRHHGANHGSAHRHFHRS